MIASLIWDHRVLPAGDYREQRVDAQDREIDLGSGEVLDMGVLMLSGQPTPLLFSIMEEAPSMDEAYFCLRRVDIRQPFGRDFRQLTSLALSLEDSEAGGFERPHDLESVFRIDDVEPDGDSEIVYRRSYIIADQGRQTSFSDPGNLVFDYDQGDPAPPPSSSFGNVSGISPNDPRYVPPPTAKSVFFAPTQMILPTGSIIPARAYLPVLLYQGDFWWLQYGNGPKMNRSVELGALPRVPLFPQLREPSGNPTLSVALSGDSIQFIVDMERGAGQSGTGEWSAILWVDTDLYGDFGDRDQMETRVRSFSIVVLLIPWPVSIDSQSPMITGHSFFLKPLGRMATLRTSPDTPYGQITHDSDCPNRTSGSPSTLTIQRPVDLLSKLLAQGHSCRIASPT